VLPGGFNSVPDIVARRAVLTQLLASLELPPNPDVMSQDRVIPGPEGEPDISVRIYRPVAAAGSLPGIYFIHGGGLAIATALLARDRGFPAVCFQMPIYPMIDDRNETASSYEISDIGSWDRAGNIEAWNWYLGEGQADLYAAPARAEDLAGLPPTFIDVGTVDLFRDEDIEFAMRLMQAGVPTELHVHPGAYHDSEGLAPEAPLSRRIWEHRIAALRRALT